MMRIAGLIPLRGGFMTRNFTNGQPHCHRRVLRCSFFDVAKRCVVISAVALSFAIAAGSTPALAKVTVVLSKDLQKAFKNNGRGWKREQKRIEDDFNKGLKELGKTHAGAKALFDSGQKIRIICHKSAEAKKLKINIGLGPAETHGDFDKKGNPKKGGTTIIAIRCKKMARLGLDGKFYDIDPRSTGIKILVHELLHATNKARRHPPDDIDIYKKFVDDFFAALKRANRAAKGRGKGDKKTSSLPAEPSQNTAFAFASPNKLALDLNLSLLGPTSQVEPTFGNSLSASSNTEEISIGADVRVPLADLGNGVSLVGGGWAKVFPEGRKKVATFERHTPTPGFDTFVFQDQLAFVFAYAGIQLQNLGATLGNPALCANGALFCDAAVTLFFGPRLQFNKVTLETDESGPRGRERFTKKETKLGFTVGADVDIPIETSGPLRYFARIGGALDYTPSTKVNGTSALGFDYEGKIRSHVDGRLFIGFGVELPPGVFTSDRRLKKDVTKVGKHENGLNLYRYRYVWGGPEWIGVMAQEVALIHPKAIVPVNGWLAVDYGKIGLRPVVLIP